LKGEQGPISLDSAATGLHGTRRRRLGGDSKLLDLHRKTPRAGRAGGGGTRRAPGGRAASTSSLPSSALLAGGGVGVGGCRPLCCWPPHLGLLVPSATGAPPSGWRRPHDIPIAAPPRPPPSLGDDIALFLPSPAMRKGKRSTAAVLPPLHDGMICIGVFFFFCRSATGTCWSRS
jgi:hypothetical protein